MDIITYVSWFQRNCRWKSPRHFPSQTGQNMATTSLTLRVAGLASVKAYEDSRGMIYVTWSIQAVKWMTNFEVQKRHDTGTNAHNYLGVPNWADGLQTLWSLVPWVFIIQNIPRRNITGDGMAVDNQHGSRHFYKQKTAENMPSN